MTMRGFKDATTSEAQVAEWWCKHPTANIGIPTGAITQLLVMDCDPRNGGPADRSDLIEQFGQIPETAEVITGGGGRHLLFRYGGGATPKTLAQGIDLKGDGGYVVAPPSMHPSGRRYEIDGIEGAKALLHLADAPDWLKERMASTPRNTRIETVVNSAKWNIGERNDQLTKLAGAMRRRGLSREAIEAALLEENRRRCDPPLPDAEVRQIAKSVARYQPKEASASLARENAGSLVTRRLSEIDAKPVTWLWPGRIARGKMSILAGNPGLGKSQVTASIAAIVTTGGYWPVDRSQCTPGDVVFLSAEDDPADTLRPRLEAAGADLNRVHVMESVISGYTPDGHAVNRAFSLQKDIQALSEKLSELGDVAAVVIDPITAYLGEVDSHRNAEVRALMAPLSELAARHSTAIIGISHLNKSAGTEALMRVTGSLAFVAAARAAYLVAQDPEDKARRFFLPMKNNIGPDSSGLAFRIEKAVVQTQSEPLQTSRVIWESDPVLTTADEIMRPQQVPEYGSARREAMEWLQGALSNPTSATEVIRMAANMGIAEKTLRRAAEMLGVVSQKSGMKSGWTWSLPTKMAKESEDAQQEGLGTFGDCDHLRDCSGGIAEVEL
jgi:hypothetical protein